MTFFYRTPSRLAVVIPFGAVQFEKWLGLSSADIAGQLVHVSEVPGYPSADFAARRDGQEVAVDEAGIVVPFGQGSLELFRKLIAIRIFGDPFGMQHARARQKVLLAELGRRSPRWAIRGGIVPHGRLVKNIGDL